MDEGVSRLLVFFNLRLVAQDCVQQRAVNFNCSIVADEAAFSKLIHKETYARPGRTDHFSQRPLTQNNRDRMCDPLFAEIREKQEKPCESSFARIEELVDQIVLNPAIARQEI